MTWLTSVGMLESGSTELTHRALHILGGHGTLLPLPAPQELQWTLQRNYFQIHLSTALSSTPEIRFELLEVVHFLSFHLLQKGYLHGN